MTRAPGKLRNLFYVFFPSSMLSLQFDCKQSYLISCRTSNGLNIHSLFVYFLQFRILILQYHQFAIMDLSLLEKTLSAIYQFGFQCFPSLGQSVHIYSLFSFQHFPIVHNVQMLLHTIVSYLQVTIGHSMLTVVVVKQRWDCVIFSQFP